MSVSVPPGKQTFLDPETGALLSLGTVTHYIPSTTLFKNTWADEDQTEVNTNPIVLDATGSCSIWGSGLYRQILKDSAGNVIWDLVTGFGDINAALPVATFADLRALNDNILNGVTLVYLEGYYTAGDGGEGWFALDSASGVPDNGGTVVIDASGNHWLREVQGIFNVKWFGAVGDGVTNDAAAIADATAVCVSADQALYFPPGSYATASPLTIGYPGTRWIADEGSQSSRWNDTRALVEIVYTGSSTAIDMVTIGGVPGNGFAPGGFNSIERVVISNISFRPATAGKARDGIRIDGGNDVVANRGFARDIELNDVSVENVGGCGINLRGNVFDVVMWRPSTVGMFDSGIKTDAAASISSGVNRPGEVWIYEAYSAPDFSTLIWSYEFVTGYVTMFGGKGQGSMGLYAGTHTQFSGVQFEEITGAGGAGSIGVQVGGRYVQGTIGSIASYETALQVGDGAESADRYQITVGELADATYGLVYTAGAAREGQIWVGGYNVVTNHAVDNRATALIPFETIYTDVWTNSNLVFRAPNITALKRRAAPPEAQEVNAGDTIQVGGGATIELTTSEGAPFSLDAQPIDDGVPGEEITFINRSGQTITFPNGAKFASATGVNVALGQSQAFKAVFSANLGRWIEIGSH